MLKKIAALLRKKPEPVIEPSFPIEKKKPTVKKATTRAVKKISKKPAKKVLAKSK